MSEIEEIPVNEIDLFSRQSRILPCSVNCLPKNIRTVFFTCRDADIPLNALLLPYVMEYNAESPAAPKYLHIAKAMGVDTVGMTEAEGVRAAVDAVRKLSLSIGIPQKLHEINVKEEDLHQLAGDAFNDVCTGGNPRPTSVEDIETLYRKAF